MNHPQFDWQRTITKNWRVNYERSSADRAHQQAYHSPRAGFESALVGFVNALGEYAAAHAKAYGSTIADDGVIGEEWQTIARGVLGLLNGERGRLDGGTIDGAIRDLARAAGFEEEL